MKDADARERLDKLEELIGALPGTVAELVSKRFESRLTTVTGQVNATLDRMRTAAEGMEGLGTVVQAMGEATNENTELVGVLERESNDLRVDVNALRETAAGLSAQLGRVLDAFAAVSSVRDPR